MLNSGEKPCIMWLWYYCAYMAVRTMKPGGFHIKPYVISQQELGISTHLVVSKAKAGTIAMQLWVRCGDNSKSSWRRLFIVVVGANRHQSKHDHNGFFVEVFFVLAVSLPCPLLSVLQASSSFRANFSSNSSLMVSSRISSSVSLSSSLTSIRNLRTLSPSQSPVKNARLPSFLRKH